MPGEIIPGMGMQYLTMNTLISTDNRTPKYSEAVGILIFSFIIIFLTGYIDVLCQLDDKVLALYSSFIMIFSLSYLLLTSKNSIGRIYNIYVFVYCIFHFGLIIIYGLGLSISPIFHAYISRWFFSYYGKYSIVLVSIGLVALIAGILFMKTIGNKDARQEKMPGKYSNQDEVLTLAGFLLVVIPVLAWFTITISHGGVGLLTGSYETFLKATAAYLSGGYFYFPIGWGLIMLTVASASQLRRLGFAVFALFALVALPLGLRGEILFPIFSSLAVAGMRGMHLTLKKTLILGFCLLCAITALRQIRHVGIDAVSMSEVTVTPFDSLAELGASIRPVVEVVSWAGSGEDFIYGQSYWAPIDRTMVYFVPGWTRPPLLEDDRLLNLLVQKRVGPIGFSPVAEAYRNFGKFGVVIIMFLTGLLLARIDLLPPTQTNQLIAGFIFFPLLVQVRNAFIFVPANIALGLVLIYLLHLFYKTNDNNVANVNACAVLARER